MTCSTLRIVSHNIADTATITVSPTPVSSLPAANLKTDIKTDVCRIMSGNVTITSTWTTEQQASCAIIPACNMSSDSEYRVRVYSDAAGAVLVYDSGWQWAAPGPILDNWDFTQVLNVNGFRYGATIVQMWFDDHYMTRRVVVDLRDPNRSYLDIARLVIGADFRPRYGASYGSSYGVEDLAKASRAASGDLRIETGPNIDTLSLDLTHIAASDRHRFARILREGVGRYHFVSAIAGDEDVTLVQDYSIYGVIQPAPMTFTTYGAHATQYIIQGW